MIHEDLQDPQDHHQRRCGLKLFLPENQLIYCAVIDVLCGRSALLDDWQYLRKGNLIGRHTHVHI